MAYFREVNMLHGPSKSTDGVASDGAQGMFFEVEPSFLAAYARSQFALLDGDRIPLSNNCAADVGATQFEFPFRYLVEDSSSPALELSQLIRQCIDRESQSSSDKDDNRTIVSRVLQRICGSRPLTVDQLLRFLQMASKVMVEAIGDYAMSEATRRRADSQCDDTTDIGVARGKPMCFSLAASHPEEVNAYIDTLLYTEVHCASIAEERERMRNRERLLLVEFGGCDFGELNRYLGISDDPARCADVKRDIEWQSEFAWGSAQFILAVRHSRSRSYL
ncbi:MAG: hypothetical protein JWP89_4385 [Schlesneria sp.]|nr:hypothetical protein [Schlesneria sp.]